MTPRLLVLDDDELVANLIRTYAQDGGFEVQVAQTAAEFFDRTGSWRPTHITLDLAVPDMDGIAVIRQLGAARCSASILLVSGLGGRVLDAAMRTGIERGLTMLGVVPKPFTRDQLTAALLGRSPMLARPSVPSEIHRSDPSGRWKPTDDDIGTALRRGQFRTFLQPIVDRVGGVRGYEALLRWQHPDRGLLAPALFLPEIERGPHLTDVTKHVLQLALSAAKEVGLPDGQRVAVNFPATLLYDISLADELARICADASVPASQVVIELTETGHISSVTDALDIVTRLRVKGFEIAIDDFGTGFSSMQQLARLPFSQLKIDRSFVSNMQGSEESRTIVDATIGLAHRLGLTALAEGVEDRSTLDLLRELNCDEFQGFYIAPPMDVTALAKWLDRWDGWPPS